MCLLKQQRIDKVEQEREMRMFISVAMAAVKVTSGLNAAVERTYNEGLYWVLWFVVLVRHGRSTQILKVLPRS